MTFDEGQELLLENVSEMDVVTLVIYVTESLEDTYAPTIEMTQLQVDQMMSFKKIGAGFSTFMYKQGLGQVPAFEDWIRTKREDELMQAWLIPECIKVVDDVE
jgi:hypothetical protein